MGMLWPFLVPAALLGQIAAATQLHQFPWQTVRGIVESLVPAHGKDLDKEKDHDFAIALFSHHKHGTSLMLQLSIYLAVKLNLQQKVVEWNTIRAWNTSGAQLAVCTPNSIMQWDDLRVGALQRVLKECPKLRAVHMVRAPSAAVASDYVFTKKFTLGGQYDQNADSIAARGAVYRSQPIAYGVRDSCARYYKSLYPQFIESYNYIHDEGLESQILQLRYEDFEEDFDAATRKMFTHIFANFNGSAYPDIDALVLGAQRFDTKRMSPGAHLRNPHIAEAFEKDETYQEMNVEFGNKDECELKLADDDRHLGYDPPF